MNILVIPTTDWIRHPVPNRLNFIFDILAEKHNVYVLHFNLKKFRENCPRSTKCTLIDADLIDTMDPSLYYLINWPKHYQKIKETIKRKNIDVVLSTNILPSFLTNFINVPIVFDYLDHLEESASIYYPDSFMGKAVKTGVSLITRYNLKHSDYVITVTEMFKDFLEGIGVKNIEVIPNGVDIKLLNPVNKEKAKKIHGLEGDILGYVGSLEHWVDLETAVQALPFLKAKILIVGPGLFTDYGDKIKLMAEELGVRDKIIFAGAVPYSELDTYISAMDIGLNPLKKLNKNEYTIGGKVFNYLACGRPVLSSRMQALVFEFGDQLHYYDDTESFIREVNNILSSEKDEMKYRKIAESFDWELIAKQYETVLRKVI